MTAPNQALSNWNALSAADAVREILPCCGSHAWAERLVAQRPFSTLKSLFAASDTVWLALPETDWQQAFDSHPRIGQQHAHSATAQSLAWSSGEQSVAMASQDDTSKLALAEGNRAYKAKFGRIFLVCAAGRSTQDILATLHERMNNTSEQELREAVEQQRQITQLRLRRWLGTTE